MITEPATTGWIAAIDPFDAGGKYVPMLEANPKARAELKPGTLYALLGEQEWVYYGQVTTDKAVASSGAEIVKSLSLKRLSPHRLCRSCQCFIHRSPELFAPVDGRSLDVVSLCPISREVGVWCNGL